MVKEQIGGESMDHSKISRNVEEALKAMGIAASTAWSGDNLVISVPVGLDPDKNSALNNFSSALTAVGFRHSVGGKGGWPVSA